MVWDGGKGGGSSEGNREGRGIAERGEAGQPASILEDREADPQQAHRKHHGHPLRKQQEHQADPPQGVHRRKRDRAARSGEVVPGPQQGTGGKGLHHPPLRRKPVLAQEDHRIVARSRQPAQQDQGEKHGPGGTAEGTHGGAAVQDHHEEQGRRPQGGDQSRKLTHRLKRGRLCEGERDIAHEEDHRQQQKDSQVYITLHQSARQYRDIY